MICVKVTCNTGKTWETRINTTLQGARDYFMGKTFVDEADDGTETRNIVVNVEELNAPSFKEFNAVDG